ncbi:VOC family protein [Actinoplanes sp. NPDC051861]|uniref:VOC family protein n=1 Tax=Actinoplanes sp. NPDC051861 TaxID=3155170 RepID=UPI003423DEEF
MSTIVYVEDMEAALAFYRDLLGFGVTFRFPDEGPPAFVALEQGISLALVVDGQIGAHGQPMRLRESRQFELCVYTDDVDKAVGELRAHGVTVLAEPADQPWGERMAYVTDPQGNPVMLCAPL